VLKEARKWSPSVGERMYRLAGGDPVPNSPPKGTAGFEPGPQQISSQRPIFRPPLRLSNAMGSVYFGLCDTRFGLCRCYAHVTLGFGTALIHPDLLLRPDIAAEYRLDRSPYVGEP